MHPKYRADIDGLRAVAVLLVVGFHAFPIWIKGGFVGVDIFFVISGFLISTIIFGSLERNSFSFIEFYGRRIRRIFPSLLLVLIASFSFGWFALLADEYKQLGRHIAAGAGFVSNFVLWLESGYFDNAAETKPLLHLWSLGVEEQFYIVWPLLLWAVWKKRFSMLAVTVLLALMSFTLNINGVKKDLVAAFYLPHARFWELLVGSVLAWFSINKRSKLIFKLQRKLDCWLGIIERVHDTDAISKTLRNVQSIVGLLLIAVAIMAVTKKSSFPGWWALLPTLGTVLVISAGAHAWTNRVILANPALVWLGLISYPLYLWHWTLLSFARIIMSETPSLEIRIYAVFISIILAWISYKFIENPMRLGGKHVSKVSVLVVIMVICCFIGSITYIRDGFSFRKAITTYENNHNELIRTPARDEACLNYINNNYPSFEYCKYTDAGARETVAVIGDSHAHVAYPGIATMLEKKNINTILLANSGCPPFVGAEYGNNFHEKNACKQRIDDLIGIILKDQNITKVIIFSRGMIYMTGRYYGDAEQNNFNYTPIAADVFYSSLQNTIKVFNDNGKETYYVTENPELPVLPNACIDRPFKINNKKCIPKLEEVQARQSEYRETINKLSGVEIIDTLYYFCPESECQVFHNGNLLYADFNHLSIAGSEFQANFIIGPRLNMKLGKPRSGVE